jgi:hypothetical protein
VRATGFREEFDQRGVEGAIIAGNAQAGHPPSRARNPAQADTPQAGACQCPSASL